MEQIVQWIQESLTAFPTIGVADIVDILIMAFIFYKLLMIVRRTSSGQVMKGVLLVVVAFVVVSAFQLRMLSYLMGKVLEWGVLALVILFQPEIRRFLEQMGRSRIGSVFVREETPGELENAITQTVLAYTDLSKTKTGALKTGTALDCVANAELLKNIFWNKAPLHDGAVIVRGGRIVGAGCMLPLSGNVNLSRELGMRHRAGIGASEHSDAVVAIVSEETGSISVAVGGMLKRHLAPEPLERLLRIAVLPLSDESDKPKFNPINIIFKSRRGEKADVEKDKGQ